MEVYKAYDEYSKTLQTRFVAFGVGGAAAPAHE